VTPPDTSSLVPLMYKMLVSVGPTQTSSDTSESKGASLISPLAMSRICHDVEDLCDVQLYLVDENTASFYNSLALSS
jgi:hypothetical protein